MMSTKLATLGLFETKVFWNKMYDAKISVHGVINKILYCDSIYIVVAVMWPKFGNSSVSMSEVIITFILYGFGQKNQFFGGMLFVQVQ